MRHVMRGGLLLGLALFMMTAPAFAGSWKQPVDKSARWQREKEERWNKWQKQNAAKLDRWRRRILIEART